MSRAELARLLADLVRRKAITRDEAELVLSAFERGDLAELPAAPTQDDGEWLAALALLLLLVNGNTRRRVPVARRLRARRLLRNRFDVEMLQLAEQVSSGGINVFAWQTGVQGALATYARQMAVAGAGRMPGAATRRAIDERLDEQWPYLRRFTVTITARQEVQRPLSARGIANRARQYGAAAWGGFFLAQGEDAGAGIVEQYITRDDHAVCRLCAPRHLQYYLPGQGPMPGDCLGVCRCERIQVFAPEIYAELTGRPERRAA